MSKVKNEGRSRYTRGQNTKEAVAYCNLNKDENRKLNGKRLLARNGCLNPPFNTNADYLQKRTTKFVLIGNFNDCCFLLLGLYFQSDFT
ncbi:hypothetical protein PROFUN_17096, partial [Planoprotostelium fungivorum]